MADERDLLKKDPKEFEPEELAGDDDIDNTVFAHHGGLKPDTGGLGGIYTDPDNPAITDDGGLAIDGGKLPGNHDDFERELGGDRNRHEPGAHASNQVSPGTTRPVAGGKDENNLILNQPDRPDESRDA